MLPARVGGTGHPGRTGAPTPATGDGGPTMTAPAPDPPRVPLARWLAAEALGTAFLVAAVIGSGHFASELSPDDTGLQLLENSIATGGILVALILALGPVSGAHLNPAVTLADVLLGGMGRAVAAAYAAAQIVGAVAGAVVANLMFELPAIELSTNATRTGAGQWLAEGVATFGLVLVILGVVRSGRAVLAAFAVAGYIVAAYWFTSSTSFANPAVSIGRMCSDTFAGIAPSAVPAFIGCQLLGAAAAVVVGRALFPDVEDAADDMIVPHEGGTNP